MIVCVVTVFVDIYMWLCCDMVDCCHVLVLLLLDDVCVWCCVLVCCCCVMFVLLFVKHILCVYGVIYIYITNVNTDVHVVDCVCE